MNNTMHRVGSFREIVVHQAKIQKDFDNSEELQLWAKGPLKPFGYVVANHTELENVVVQI
jgi:hypothetical protein